ncbi:MAG: SDR family oxidoreductase, partial [Anaerolineales bacterium]
MILVTGSAGKTGRAIIQALVKGGESVRVLAHRPDQVARLEALGVDDVLVGDMLDSASVTRAVQGIRAIYHIAPNVNPDEETIGRIIVDAARSANVERFVFHSVLHPQIEAMPHHWQKLRVEEMLFESGLFFTILQPTIYMQNILAYWDQIITDGIYPVPYSPESLLSMVDLDDVAQVAVMALTEPGHQSAVYELVGVSAMSQTDVANMLNEQLHRPVTVKIVSREDWERNARASGLGEFQVATLIKMFCFYERYGFAGNPNVLSYLLQ